jgi:hypothetical protein
MMTLSFPRKEKKMQVELPFFCMLYTKKRKENLLKNFNINIFKMFSSITKIINIAEKELNEIIFHLKKKKCLVF